MERTEAEKGCAVPACGARQFGHRGQIADANVMRPSQARDLTRKSPRPAPLERLRLIAAPRRNAEERFRGSVARLPDELVVAVRSVGEPRNGPALVVLDTRAACAVAAVLELDLPF